ncbi:MAG TPA: hypothetical protein PKH77_05220 [Anaerolineae bacterium]|nr:hypothetical protein [Anaerolineae bacterium]
MDQRSLKIGAGVIGGFIIGVILSTILTDTYDIIGGICWSAILVPLCTFGLGLFVAFRTHPPDDSES